ncbi:hypothetical protein JGU66_18610 [Myxococcaceae bacterium JPH2]|nr:hypothetical protein [Myxococcaceae bacterium JPH2]
MPIELSESDVSSASIAADRALLLGHADAALCRELARYVQVMAPTYREAQVALHEVEGLRSDLDSAEWTNDAAETRADEAEERSEREARRRRQVEQEACGFAFAVGLGWGEVSRG